MNLKEAESLAIKSIKKFLNPSFLTNENIGYVTLFILKAFHKYDASKGTKLDTWLFNYSRGACLHLARDRKKKSNTMLVTNNEDYFMSAIKQHDESEVSLEVFELVKDLLSTQENKILTMIFVQGYKVRECADELKVTRQHIFNVLKKIKGKVQNAYKTKEDLVKWAKK